MKKGLIVAIDGPAGSGKSTVTHLLSRKLNYNHIDTGALYRAIALKAQREKIPFDAAEKIGEVARNANLSFQWIDDERNHIFLDGQDVSALIRTPELSMAASQISAHPQVRDALLGVQRKLGENGGVVLEGRDIGTVIFPNADVKFFLTATVESRSRRRMVELEEKGIYLGIEAVQAQVIERDRGDTERKTAPLRKADDAIEVDTTKMTVEQVVQTLYNKVKEKEASCLKA